MTDTIVIELTREECHCIHRLCDYARARNEVYYRNHTDLVKGVDDKMIAGYNCLFCNKNLVECKCVIREGKRQDIEP